MLENDFYTILDKNLLEGGVDYRIKLNKNHFIYQAHFPQNPVTPGVCLLEIGKNLLAGFLQTQLILTTAKNIKFLSILNPQSTPTVHYRISFIKDEQGLIHAKINVENGDFTFAKISAVYKSV
jgi:3-hydroxyacyl-[acyl-carrier-protein] dehydratase